MQRRKFLATAGGCAAHLMTLGNVAPAFARRVFMPQQEENVVASEPWGRLEEIAKGVWAHVATPFDTRDFTTVSNGGIIEGKNGVLAVEGFMQPAGAKWLAEQAKALTGRWPTDVVVTHYHGDHTSGHAGYFTDEFQPNFWITESTHVNAEKSFEEKGEDAPPKFKNVQWLSSEGPTEMDLGGRVVNIVPRSGHTNSDVSIELVDPKVIWTGDLYFNRMFPNYGDAIPDKLNEYGNSLVQLENDVIVVPGHGPLADHEAARIYVDFLGVVQSAAEEAIKAGDDLEAKAKEFKLPERLEDWMIWSPDNAVKAFAAWERVLKVE